MINTIKADIKGKHDSAKTINQELARLKGVNSIFDDQIQPAYTLVAKNCASVARVQHAEQIQDARLAKLEDTDLPALLQRINDLQGIVDNLEIQINALPSTDGLAARADAIENTVNDASTRIGNLSSSTGTLSLELTEADLEN